MRDTNGSRVVSWGSNTSSDTTTNGGVFNATEGIVHEPPYESNFQHEGKKWNKGHEFCLTWGHGFTATPGAFTPCPLACPSPHSDPQFDKESPCSCSARSHPRFDDESLGSLGCDQHLAAAEVIQQTMTVDAHNWLCGHHEGHFLWDSDTLTNDDLNILGVPADAQLAILGLHYCFRDKKPNTCSLHKYMHWPKWDVLQVDTFVEF
jgi:hypothetical protein